LDIVRRIAVDSGGSMSMDRSPSGGARVELRLGAPFREAG
jgi:C4-dicarboxylate-specific signal transduction histidine kinase